LRLIQREQGRDYPTHGLLILLGRYEHVETKCSRFKGNTMAVFLDKKEYRGDLFHQLEQTELFIKNHLHLKAEILGLQRTESYEIPMPAIREVLVNAVLHRDYSNSGRDIKVGIYDDMLNIVSPGGLPNGLTEADLQQGRSEIRNRLGPSIQGTGLY
jgi:ATP-dependent DNA helicase RecG